MTEHFSETRHYFKMDSHVIKGKSKGQANGRAKPNDVTRKTLKNKPDPKRDKATLYQNSHIFSMPSTSENYTDNTCNVFDKSEINVENLNVFIDKDGVVMTNNKNIQAIDEEKMNYIAGDTEKNSEFNATLTDTNSSNSNYFVYVDNSSGSQILSHAVSSGNVLHSTNEISHIGMETRNNMVPSTLSYFSGNILETDKITTTTEIPEQSVTVVFDPDLPQQDPQQIFIDSSSLVDLNQAVVLAPDGSVTLEKDNHQSLRQSFMTTQSANDDEKNLHSILMTSQDLNSDSFTNTVKFLPVTTVNWEHDNKATEPGPPQEIIHGVLDKTDLKELEVEELEQEMEQQRQVNMRNLEQSHLAHQTFLIEQRVKKENKIEISSLEEHLKGLGIDDSTPIFSSVTAKINPLILTHVPGCQQFLLKDANASTKATMVNFESDTDCSFQGNVTELLSLHNAVKSFLHLKSQTNVSFQIVGNDKDKKEDKSIYCNLLVPYVSSKGRISMQSMKAKQAEILSILDEELSGEEVTNHDENYKRRQTVRKRQNKSKLLRSKKVRNSSFLQLKKDSELAATNKSLDTPFDGENLVSTAEDQVTGDKNFSSVDLNDPLQRRLRQEQIKYRQIVDNTYKMRKLKSAMIESSKRVSSDQGDFDELHEKKDDKSDEAPPRKKKGRPPKQFDPSESIEKVHPRNPLTESETTKQQRVYEEHVAFKFFCNQCSFKTKRKSHFEAHLQCHNKYPDTLYICKVCNFVSISLSTLRRHELKHKKNLLRCDICSAYKTDKKHLMQRHIRLKHSNLEDHPKFKCEQCSAEFPTSMGLTRHTAKHIRALVEKAIENTSFTCSHCQKDFRQRIHLHRHVRDVHGPEIRPYLCDKCGKSFKRTDALQQHKLVHVARSARKLPFECNECHKCFRSQAHLKEHMSMHSTERPFLCHFCGAAFKTQPVQKKHILTLHIRPRTHVCGVCCRQFNTKNALVKHETTHKPPDESLGQDDQLWPTAEKELADTDKSVEYGTQEMEHFGLNVDKVTEKSIGSITPAIVVNVASGTGVVFSNNGSITSNIVDHSEIGSGDITEPETEAQQQNYIHTSQAQQSFYYLTN